MLQGEIAREGSGYRINVSAIDASVEQGQAKPLASQTVTARDKGQVLSAIGTVANELRSVLGDTAASSKDGAAETATTTSLEALQAYTQGAELKRMNRNVEAMVAYDKAIARDPEFGRAYAGKGDIYMILKDEGKAKVAFEEALKHVDRMSEREKYRTFGNYYLNIARNNRRSRRFDLRRAIPADDGGRLATWVLRTPALSCDRVRRKRGIYPKNALQFTTTRYSLYWRLRRPAKALVCSGNTSFTYAICRSHGRRWHAATPRRQMRRELEATGLKYAGAARTRRSRDGARTLPSCSPFSPRPRK